MGSSSVAWRAESSTGRVSCTTVHVGKAHLAIPRELIRRCVGHALFTHHPAACHPGGNPGANLKSISHRCYLFEVAFVWELTQETIHLPLGCLQGGIGSANP